MKSPLLQMGIGIALMGLAACGSGETPTSEAPAGEGAAAADTVLPNGDTAKSVIEARQAALKRTGKNFKAIADQVKGGEIDTTVVSDSAAVVSETASNIANWFPAGTSAAAGVKTRALDAIWEKPDEFAAAIEKLQGASSVLTAAAESGDSSAIEAAFKETGAACKNCHDNFRAEEDR